MVHQPVVAMHDAHVVTKAAYKTNPIRIIVLPRRARFGLSHRLASALVSGQSGVRGDVRIKQELRG